MKRLIPLLLLLLAFNLGGCATTGLNGTSTVPAAVVSAQDAATKSLYAIGALLQATPGVLDALYNASKINKDQYNQSALVYNQALSSFNIACEALKTAISAGQDPASISAYVSALQSFLSDKTVLDNLMTAIGSQPIGTAITGGVK